MKITKVEVMLTGTTWRNFLFVKLTTDSGLSVGETGRWNGKRTLFVNSFWISAGDTL